jgi:hypothetical protein
MKVVQIPNGRFVQNCYLVADEASRECAVIDPGEDAALIRRSHLRGASHAGALARERVAGGVRRRIRG